MNAAGRKILIVDDDPECLRSLSFFLRSRGYEAVEARDGETALQAFEDQHPALVLSDVLLPKISGFDLCRNLKSARTPASPVFLMSAVYKKMDVQREALGRSGADEYLIKPIEPEDLLRRIEERLGRGTRAPKTAPLLPAGTAAPPPEVAGRFSGDGLPRLIGDLHQRLETGILHLEREGDRRRLFWLEGRPAFATAPRLGPRTEREAIYEAMLETFAWTQGEYRFERDRSFVQFLPRFGFDPVQLVEEGVRRHFALSRLQAILAPHRRLVLGAGPHLHLGQSRAEPSSPWERLLQTADGRLTVEEALGRCGLALTQGCQVLVVLLSLGILRAA